LIIPNPYGLFKLKGRKMIFQGGGNYNDIRSLILKEKISNKVLEVFILLLLMFNIIISFIFYVLQKNKIRRR
jgi:hypothetical protein